MQIISVRRFAFALATVVTVLYAGCALVMAVVPRSAALRFFNRLMHGIDVEPIARWEMSLGEMAVGLIETFILGWLIGAAFAWLYNVAAPQPKNRSWPDP